MTVSAVTGCLGVAAVSWMAAMNLVKVTLIQLGTRYRVNTSRDTRGVCHGSSPAHAESVTSRVGIRYGGDGVLILIALPLFPLPPLAYKGL